MESPETPGFYDTQKEIINRQLDSVLPPSSESRLTEAMRFSTMNGGKRFRGILLLEAERLGPAQKSTLAPRLAAGLELVHAYSLVHDDLPAMDNDDHRRGAKACHVKFDEHTAVLCGNSLLSLAYDIFHKSAFPNPSKNLISPIDLLTNVTGYDGVPLGQQRDMDFENTTPSRNEILEMYKKKTGKLIGFALQLGALAGGSKPQLANELKTIGEELGVAYQIVDDLIEFESDQKIDESSESSDTRNGKETLVRKIGKIESKSMVREKLRTVSSSLDSLNKPTSRINKMIRLALNRVHTNSLSSGQ